MREKDFTATAPRLRVQGCLRLDLLRLGLLRVWTTREGQSNPKPSYATIIQWVRIVWFIQRCIQILSGIQIQTVEITSGSFLHSCRFVFGGVKTAFVSAQKATIKNWEFYGLFVFQSLLWSVLFVLTIISCWPLVVPPWSWQAVEPRQVLREEQNACRDQKKTWKLLQILYLVKTLTYDLIDCCSISHLTCLLYLLKYWLLLSLFLKIIKKSHENILWIWINAEST